MASYNPNDTNGCNKKTCVKRNMENSDNVQKVLQFPQNTSTVNFRNFPINNKSNSELSNAAEIDEIVHSDQPLVSAAKEISQATNLSPNSDLPENSEEEDACVCETCVYCIEIKRIESLEVQQVYSLNNLRSAEDLVSVREQAADVDDACICETCVFCQELKNLERLEAEEEYLSKKNLSEAFQDITSCKKDEMQEACTSESCVFCQEIRKLERLEAGEQNLLDDYSTYAKASKISSLHGEHETKKLCSVEECAYAKEIKTVEKLEAQEGSNKISPESTMGMSTCEVTHVKPASEFQPVINELRMQAGEENHITTFAYPPDTLHENAPQKHISVRSHPPTDSKPFYEIQSTHGIAKSLRTVKKHRKFRTTLLKMIDYSERLLQMFDEADMVAAAERNSSENIQLLYTTHGSLPVSGVTLSKSDFAVAAETPHFQMSTVQSQRDTLFNIPDISESISDASLSINQLTHRSLIRSSRASLNISRDWNPRCDDDSELHNKHKRSRAVKCSPSVGTNYTVRRDLMFENNPGDFTLPDANSDEPTPPLSVLKPALKNAKRTADFHIQSRSAAGGWSQMHVSFKGVDFNNLSYIVKNPQAPASSDSSEQEEQQLGEPIRYQRLSHHSLKTNESLGYGSYMRTRRLQDAVFIKLDPNEDYKKIDELLPPVRNLASEPSQKFAATQTMPDANFEIEVRSVAMGGAPNFSEQRNSNLPNNLREFAGRQMFGSEIQESSSSISRDWNSHFSADDPNSDCNRSGDLKSSASELRQHAFAKNLFFENDLADLIMPSDYQPETRNPEKTSEPENLFHSYMKKNSSNEKFSTKMRREIAGQEFNNRGSTTSLSNVLGDGKEHVEDDRTHTSDAQHVSQVREETLNSRISKVPIKNQTSEGRSVIKTYHMEHKISSNDEKTQPPSQSSSPTQNFESNDSIPNTKVILSVPPNSLMSEDSQVSLQPAGIPSQIENIITKERKEIKIQQIKSTTPCPNKCGWPECPFFNESNQQTQAQFHPLGWGLRPQRSLVLRSLENSFSIDRDNFQRLSDLLSMMPKNCQGCYCCCSSHRYNCPPNHSLMQLPSGTQDFIHHQGELNNRRLRQIESSRQDFNNNCDSKRSNKKKKSKKGFRGVVMSCFNILLVLWIFLQRVLLNCIREVPKLFTDITNELDLNSAYCLDEDSQD